MHGETETQRPLDARLHDIHIRDITPEDAHRLQLFHQRLSSETITLRFHGSKRELSDPLAYNFTHLDGHDDVAVVATTGTRGRIVGVARYSRLDPSTAEVAFVIEDAYQHHGIGHRLMRHLKERALENGIRRFVADVLPGNAPMLKLLEEAGPTKVEFDSCAYVVQVDITSGP